MPPLREGRWLVSIRRFVIWLRSAKCCDCGKRRIMHGLGSCRKCFRRFARLLRQGIRETFGCRCREASHD